MTETVTGASSDVRPSVLLVEDNPLHARLVVSMLSEAWPGFASLTHAKRLDEALRAVEEHPPECVLLDLVLPDADGLTAVESLIGLDAGLPVIVLSSHADEATAATALGLGAQDYLVKGTVDARQLTRAIRHAVFRHRHRAPATSASNVVDLPVGSRSGSEASPAEAGEAGVGVVDRTGVLRYVEPGVGEMLGRRLDQLVGRPLAELVHPQDLDVWRDALAALHASPEDRSQVTLRMKHESGTEQRVRIELDPLRGGTGAVDAFLARYVPVLEEGTDASGGTYVVMSGWSR